jgi:flavorubredoxin
LDKGNFLDWTLHHLRHSLNLIDVVSLHWSGALMTMPDTLLFSCGAVLLVATVGRVITFVWRELSRINKPKTKSKSNK